jgi:AraC family L-rhamnose operon transcriptional activator RhaR
METHSSNPRARFTDLNQVAFSLRLGNFTGELLHWGFIEPQRWRNSLHTHSFFEICYAFEGRGIFRIAGRDESVQAGQVFVARPGQTHEIISSEADPLGIYFWSYTLIPSRECQYEAGVDVLLNAFLASQKPLSTPPPAMSRILELLTEEIVQKAPGYVQALSGLVVKLLLDTARAVVEVPPQCIQDELSTKSPEGTVIPMVVRYLRDNYNRAISMRDLEVQVHLSERHISRLFRNVMGMSVLEYVTNLRVEIAAQLLLEQRLAIKEVAQATGYPDVRYFTTLFRQHTGLTPAVFRQNGGTSFLEPTSEHR